MEWLASIKIFLKKYWQILLGFSAVLTYIIFRKKPESPSLSSSVRNSSTQFADDVQTARGEETTATAAENSRHEQAMETITQK